MRLELCPDRSLKWTISWCLTIPPDTQLMFGYPGMSAMLFKKQTLLFFMQFTRNTPNTMGQPSMGSEPQSIVVPLVYDISRNSLAIPSREWLTSVPIFVLINQILARCNEYNMHNSECLIFSSIHEVMCNDLIVT